MASDEVDDEGLFIAERLAYWHRNMGPPERFPCCGGRGYTLRCIDDHDCDESEGRDCTVVDVYCSCAAGRKRAAIEAEDADGE